jgi:type IV fimbrial biogenesis protein FimT
MRHVNKRKSNGATLTSLVVAIAISGALVALAVPAYGDILAYLRLRSESQALSLALMLARSEAIKRNARVNVCKSTDLKRCAKAGGFEAGWIIYQDPGRTGQPDPDAPLIRVKSGAPEGITIRGNKPVADLVSYTTWGHARTLSGALQIGTFVVCRKGLFAVQVVLASTGRVRIENSRDICV